MRGPCYDEERIVEVGDPATEGREEEEAPATNGSRGESDLDKFLRGEQEK